MITDAKAEMDENHRRTMVLLAMAVGMAWNVWHAVADACSASHDHPAATVISLACIVLAVLMTVSAIVMAGLRGTTTRVVRPVMFHALGISVLGVMAHLPCRALPEIGHWATGAVGWLGVLFTFYSRTRLAGSILIGLPPIGLALWVVLHHLDHPTTSHLLSQVLITTSAQICVVAVHRTTKQAIRRVTTAAQREATVKARDGATQALRESRRRRFEQLDREFIGLLAELANGELDPANAQARHRCGLAVAKMRRQLTEAGTATTPLQHELRACADAAERRGVIVDLVTTDEVPDIPAPQRRAMTAVASGALAAAESNARATLITEDNTVILSIFTDNASRTVPLDDIPQEGIVTECHCEGEVLWVQAHWTPGSESPSSTTTQS